MNRPLYKILSVIANPEIRARVQTLFQAAASQAEWMLSFAADLEDAQTLIHAAPVDLILFGLYPDSDEGRSALEQLAAPPAAPPILVLTPFWSDALLTEVQNLGGCELLSLAEATPSELLRAIRAAVRPFGGYDALQRNDLLFRAAFRSSVVGMCITRPNGHFLEANPALCRLLGLSQSELAHRNFSSIIHPEDSERMRRLSADALQEKISSFQIEVRLLHQSGREKWVQWNIALIRDVRHRPLYFLNLAQDITQRRAAEHALRESEQKFRSLVERSSEAIALLSAEGRFTYLSSNADQVLGYSVEELLGLSLIELVHTHHQPQMAVGLARLMQKQDRVERILFRFRHKDGSWRWIEAILTNLLHDPAVRGIVTNMRDVTERKHWEEALASSEERYRDLVMNANDLILTLDQDGRIIEINRAVEGITGYSRPHMLGTSFYDYIAPEHRLIARHMLRADPASTRNRYELEIIARNGDRLQLEVGIRHLCRPGQPVRIQGIARDITERRRALQALERQGLIFENLSDAVIVTDSNRRIVECNRAAENLLGYERTELLGETPSLFYPADQADRLNEEMQAGIRAQGRWRGEISLVRKDGTRAICDSVMVQLCDAQGRTIAIADVIHDLTERVRSEAALRQSEERYRAVVEQSADGIFLFEADRHRIIDSNAAFQRMIGYSGDELLLLTLDQIVASNDPPIQHNINAVLRQGRHILGERAYVRKDGQVIEVEVSASLISAQGAQIVCALVRDIRQRRSLESQLRQAQKMEAVGRLAGGVAHDFNNLLTVITGYTDLLQASTAPGDERGRFVHEIGQAADRAAALTRQLLAFSRQQVLTPRIFDLNLTLTETGAMLRRLIGEDIQLDIAPSSRPALLRADSRQIEQVILNLAVNARDAMPDGGHLRLDVTISDLDADACTSMPGAVPGRYVVLSVNDTGTGMDANTRSHIFEPFFTTKGEKGTGLGLSTVYGIVNQSGGFIRVQSELKRGTTFRIYLPMAIMEAPEPSIAAPAEPPPSGPPSSTILLVEDQDELRQLLADVLSTAGYQVLTAAHGLDAIEVCSAHSGPLHLLITDMVMPYMNGNVVAERVRALHPETSVLYISGYTEYGSGSDTRWKDREFLQKPFTPGEFLGKVRQALLPACPSVPSQPAH